jgi:hypothetical protein
MSTAVKTSVHPANCVAAVMLLTLLSARASGAEDALAPWSSNHHPSDVPKTHIQEITAGRVDYAVAQGGTMDGRNCRSPNSAYVPFQQTWESNRLVRMENVGTTDVINPWLSNGRNDFRNMGEIVAAAVRPGMSDREKAYALWWQEIRYRYHWQNVDNDELCDPVKVFNVYGFNTCGNDSICLAGLWRTAGLTRTAPCRAVGHCITQTFFDGRWHLLDGDMNAVYLLRDNRTIAGEQDVVRDRDLVRRTHTEGILSPDGNRGADEHEAALYVFEGAVTGERRCAEGTTMNMVLRPGEALTWRWGHLDPIKEHGNSTRFPHTVCNGRWEYRPSFHNDAWRGGATSVDGITADAQGLRAEPGKTGSIVWNLHTPYVLVGGTLDVEGRGATFSISWDGRTWQDVNGDFDKFFTAPTPARYAYRLRCQLAGDARLKRLGIVNDLQMAPLALPEMAVGDNTFTYRDETRGERKVRITHEWVERSASTPPDAPPAAVFPPDGGVVDGTRLVFQWTPARDADGDRIADYHFELSDYDDMRWPLSMSFAKFGSKTADAGKPQYALPAAGLLNPDTTYFWHVRAKDDNGVWGPWSKTWSFKARAAAPPVDVTLDFDPGRGVGTLRWNPGAIGVTPVRYRVYGSDEKGFSTSDQPYKAGVGISKDLPSTFPANFIAETSATELAVLGAPVDLPAANKTYYRVVAVDERGNPSGPSDYATAPRPVIYSKPLTVATAGQPYRYQVRATRSLGDLTARQVQANGKEVMNYWSLEKPAFAIRQGPKWLTVDPATGVLSGTPDAAGKSEVVVTAAIDRDVRTVDEGALKWGNEKVVSTAVERVGATAQKFTIEVGSGTP